MKHTTRLMVPLGIGILIGTVISHSLLHGQLDVPRIPAEKTSYRDTVKRILPAVVSLEAKTLPAKKSTVQGTKPKGLKDPTQPGFGSGVIVDGSGVILTNYHVVRGATEVRVVTKAGTEYFSKDIRTDPKTDIAIIMIKPDKPLPTLSLGDSEAMEIGDRVLAVGAPFGLTGSVTAGIISGKGRSLQMNLYEDFLQTDAAINPGNSGGPLVDLHGNVIGINTAIKSHSGGSQGVGLAISSRLIRKVMPQLIKDGVVRRGYLGAQVQDLTNKALATRLGVRKDEKGVIVSSVYNGSPAEKAGLKGGDVLLTVNATPVPDGKGLQDLVSKLPLNKEVVITLLRDRKAYQGKLVIEEQPSTYGQTQVKPPLAPRSGTVAWFKDLGVEVLQLRDVTAQRLGYPPDLAGLVVTKVKTGPAEKVLRRGAVILKVGLTRVKTFDDLKAALDKDTMARGALLQWYAPQVGVSYSLLAAKP